MVLCAACLRDLQAVSQSFLIDEQNAAGAKRVLDSQPCPERTAEEIAQCPDSVKEALLVACREVRDRAETEDWDALDMQLVRSAIEKAEAGECLTREDEDE